MAAPTRFEDLTLPHRAAAFNLAYWIVGRRDEADDVVQDAFVRAFRGFSGFKGDDVRPWLLTIVRNVALRALQNRKRSGNVISIDEALLPRDGRPQREFASDEPSPEASLIAQGERETLLAALAEVAVVYREILVLREIEGLAYKDIAEVVGVPMGTVMSRLARGRDELRAALLRRLERDEKNAV